MKARVKDTGEIVDVKFATHPNPAVDETYWWCSDKQESYHKSELDFMGSTIDWEQRRYEIAKEVLAKIPVNNYELLANNGNKVSIAVKRADALIKELKGGEE